MTGLETVKKREKEEVTKEVPGWLEPERNPLLNSVVLQVFFEHAPVDILKNCREVCKEWWKLSLGRFRETHKIVMKKKRIDKYVEWVDLPNDPYGFEKHPFSKYKVEKDTHRPGFKRGVVTIQEFWTKFGGRMKQLEIKREWFDGSETFRRILFELTPNLEVLSLCENGYEHCLDDEIHNEFFFNLGNVLPRPNLKSLKVTLLDGHSETGLAGPVGGREARDAISLEEYLPLSWMRVLAHFPFLKELLLEQVDLDPLEVNYDSPEYEELNIILFMIRHLKVDRPATHFVLERLNILNAQKEALYEFPWNTLLKLERLGFPLTSLVFDVGVITDEQLFQDLLQLYAATLRNLTIARAPLAPPFTTFPFEVSLEFMSELRLYGPIAPNMLFLKYTPNLKLLHLMKFDAAKKPYGIASRKVSEASDSENEERARDTNDDDEENSGYDGDGEESDTQEVEQTPVPFNCLHHHLTNTNLAEFGQILLPKLEEFVTDDEGCTTEQLGALTRVMPNLKRLGIGVKTEAFRVICENWTNLAWLEIRIEKTNLLDAAILGLSFGMSKQPVFCLPHLQYLRHLKIDMIHTDAAIYNGIFKLPHLTSLEGNCAFSVSEAAFGDLVSKFPLPLSTISRPSITFN
ncbi:hypothetical protein Ocin01_07913 [Orchesella cincta]|uniref:Uncharacterized protein n=1 Tax=Orchesella cincta TaxID=48709 RepID=A0A1D2N0F2_ORCCI|nr:hypothetical protein Ocin01_07913 [Orchesella cincta]